MTEDEKKSLATLDAEALNKVTMGDAGFQAALLGKVQNQFTEIDQRVRAGLESEDWEDIGQAAHKLKSTVTYLGMSGFREILQDLELSAKANAGAEKLTRLSHQVLELISFAKTEVENFSG